MDQWLSSTIVYTHGFHPSNQIHIQGAMPVSQFLSIERGWLAVKISLLKNASITKITLLGERERSFVELWIGAREIHFTSALCPIYNSRGGDWLDYDLLAGLQLMYSYSPHRLCHIYSLELSWERKTSVMCRLANKGMIRNNTLYIDSFQEYFIVFCDKNGSSQRMDGLSTSLEREREREQVETSARWLKVKQH